MSQQREITVYPDRLKGVWAACFHGEKSVLDAFGVDILETGYLLTEAGHVVQAALQTAHPAHHVRLVDVDGLRF